MLFRDGITRSEVAYEKRRSKRIVFLRIKGLGRFFQNGNLLFLFDLELFEVSAK